MMLSNRLSRDEYYKIYTAMLPSIQQNDNEYEFYIRNPGHYGKDTYGVGMMRNFILAIREAEEEKKKLLMLRQAIQGLG